MPVESGMLEKMAKDLGLNAISGRESPEGVTNFTAWEGWAYARWLCEVTIREGRIEAKQIHFLD